MRVTAEARQESTGLIPIEDVNAIELFTGGKLDGLLKQIEAEVQDAPTDTSTDRARKEIASTAYKVARSKTVIDEAGKALTDDWRKKVDEVNAGRRHARQYLDELKDRVRQPLTEWEEEQKRIEAEEKLKAEIEAAHDEALEMDALLEREKELARREAEIARQEAERQERERKEREAAERKAWEEKAQRDAEERARKEAAEALKREQEARERAEREAKEAAERAERDRIAAEERAKREAEEAAERERQRAEREAAEREAARQAAEEQKRREEEARRADKANRDRVIAAAVAALKEEGVKHAEEVIRLIASGSVPNVSIRF